jgi:hypothetical protein
LIESNMKSCCSRQMLRASMAPLSVLESLSNVVILLNMALAVPRVALTSISSALTTSKGPWKSFERVSIQILLCYIYFWFQDRLLW